MYLNTIDDPIDLSQVAEAIRKSSNFRFAWQFYHIYAGDLLSCRTIRTALDSITQREDLHGFLRESLDDNYPREFHIEPLHCHASIERDGSYFIDTLTRAKLDRLGAYSRDLTRSTATERDPVHQLFASIGTYSAYMTRRGSDPDCDICKHTNNDLFCNWFYNVAWDYTFLLMWPAVSVFWMGCLTDTD